MSHSCVSKRFKWLCPSCLALVKFPCPGDGGAAYMVSAMDRHLGSALDDFQSQLSHRLSPANGLKAALTPQRGQGSVPGPG